MEFDWFNQVSEKQIIENVWLRAPIRCKKSSPFARMLLILEWIIEKDDFGPGPVVLELC